MNLDCRVHLTQSQVSLDESNQSRHGSANALVPPNANELQTVQRTSSANDGTGLATHDDGSTSPSKAQRLKWMRKSAINADTDDDDDRPVAEVHLVGESLLDGCALHA